MIRCFLLAGLVAVAAPAALAQVPADTLLDAVIARIGLDRFHEKSFPETPRRPFAGLDLPREAELGRRWDAQFTLPWFLDRYRAEFLRQSSADDVRVLAEWVEDPVVRGVIATDYSGGGFREGGFERIEEGLTMGRLDPRFEAAIRRIAAAAGEGGVGLKWEAEEAMAYSRYVMAFVPPHQRVPEAEIEAYALGAVEESRESTAREFVVFVGGRFEGVPVDALEHYAEALETEGGQIYLRLIVEAPQAARVAAIQQTLAKVRP